MEFRLLKNYVSDIRLNVRRCNLGAVLRLLRDDGPLFQRRGAVHGLEDVVAWCDGTLRRQLRSLNELALARQSKGVCGGGFPVRRRRQDAVILASTVLINLELKAVKSFVEVFLAFLSCSL